MQGKAGRGALPQPSREEGGKTDTRQSQDNPPSWTTPHGPLAIFTTGVWERESMFMRWMEKGLVKVVERWSKPPKGHPLDTANFVRHVAPPEAPKQSGFIEELLSIFRRT
jgi:phosphatidylglycerophosphatase GEP4